LLDILWCFATLYCIFCLPSYYVHGETLRDNALRSQILPRPTLHGEVLQSNGVQLSLKDALEIADKENPQAKAALSQIGVTRTEKLIADAFPNPSLVTDNGIRSERFVG